MTRVFPMEQKKERIDRWFSIRSNAVTVFNFILIDMIAYANCITWLSNSFTVSRGNSV
jgi:hypothetical protein